MANHNWSLLANQQIFRIRIIMVCSRDLIWGQANWWESLEQTSFRVQVWRESDNNHPFFHIKDQRWLYSLNRNKMRLVTWKLFTQV